MLTAPKQQPVPAGSGERTDELRESLHRLADHLAAIPAADHDDYRQRRRQHESWHLSDDEFAKLVERFVTANNRKPTAPADQLHEALSALIWSQVTGSEPSLAPLLPPALRATGPQHHQNRSVGAGWEPEELGCLLGVHVAGGGLGEQDRGRTPEPTRVGWERAVRVRPEDPEPLVG